MGVISSLPVPIHLQKMDPLLVEVWMVYLKKLIAKLKDHDEAKLTEFKAAFKEVNKFLSSNFLKIPKSDWQSCIDIYVPDGCYFDGESMLILSKYTGDAPEFYYLKYGLT